jgi:hypothetical protein
MQSIPGIIVQGRYDFVCPLVVGLLDPNLSVELMLKLHLSLDRIFSVFH